MSTIIKLFQKKIMIRIILNIKNKTGFNHLYKSLIESLINDLSFYIAYI